LKPVGDPVIFIRSVLFNIVLYVLTAGLAVLYLTLLILPRKVLIRAMEVWAHLVNALVLPIAGLKLEVRGREHLPPGPVLVAVKHQSMWDTIMGHIMADDPAIVLKHELSYIPVYGWLAMRAQMIIVDREAGAKAMRHLLRRSEAAIAAGRPVLIFPEGTRQAVDAPPDYQPGVAAIYSHLKVPCVPAALNSGLFWPRRRFLRLPGTIVLEYLPPIPPGLPRKQFMAELESRIEGATARLVAESRAKGEGIPAT